MPFEAINHMESYDNVVFGIISIFIAIGLFLLIRTVIKIKLKNLHGTQKLLGLFLVIIIVSELIYLGLQFDLFTLAASLIASLGVSFALISFALQNHLKNMISGIGLYLNKRIDLGDIIEIDGKKGTIIEFHLMKTIALTDDDGQFMNIPNLKFSESVIFISHSNRKK